jgi:AraC-like DNA-binding protein
MFLDRAASFGVRRDDVLRAAGLRESDLADPDGRLPLSRIRDVWRALITRVQSPSFGLDLGRTIKLRELGLVGYAMAHSSTLGDALSRLSRYLRIVNEALQCRLEKDGPDTRIVMLGHPTLDALRHPLDLRLSIVLASAREVTGAHVVPREVEFPYGRSSPLPVYRRAFAGARLSFDRPRATITLRARDVGRAAATPDPTLGRYLDQLAQHVLGSLERAQSNFTDQVARAIWPVLSGALPSVAQTAAAVGVSGRTLQRRLREEGTTYALVLDQLRRELSASLLHDRRLAIYEIAFLLGYSEPSAFYRAFRRWHRVSPAKYRARIR